MLNILEEVKWTKVVSGQATPDSVSIGAVLKKVVTVLTPKPPTATGNTQPYKNCSKQCNSSSYIFRS